MGLKITTFVAQQTITVVIDPSNSIPESSDGDNQRSISYTMQQGGCP
jgi:subtilase family serine protease